MLLGGPPVELKGRGTVGQIGSTIELALGKRRRSERLSKLATRSLAHDLRTPLARIRGFLENAENVTADTQGKIDDSLEQIELLNHTIARLMTYVYLEDGSFGRRSEQIDLSELLSSLAEDYEVVLEELDSQLHTQIQPDISLSGLSDLMQQAVINVIENSIKYGMQKARLDLNLRTEDCFAVIEVRDYGPGVDPAYLDQICRPYEQQPEHRQQGGGLGLSLVSGIIDYHNGHLEVANAEPGLVTRMRFPLG